MQGALKKLTVIVIAYFLESKCSVFFFWRTYTVVGRIGRNLGNALFSYFPWVEYVGYHSHPFKPGILDGMSDWD